MKIFLSLLLLSLASLLSFAAGAQTPGDEAARQVLVMLQLPKAHYRPDSAYAGSYGDGVGLQARKQVAEALARKHALELQSEWPMPVAGVDCFVMRLPAGDARSPEQAAKAVSADARVAWAQPVNVYHAQGSEQEPLYPTQPAARQWHLADLHTLATGKGVRVAVIDSGIEASHPDLAGQLALNENFVDDGGPLRAESHGTAVAGIIAARADNHLGIAGIAPRAQLLGYRACWQTPADTLCTSLSLAKALHAAVLQRAQIINMSLGGPGDRLLGVLIDQALDRGIAVVAAVGAEGKSFPASHPGVLAVGNAPPLPAGAVQAPGKDVPSTALGGGWALVSGSSFSAAHVSGLLALLSELDSGNNKLQTLRIALVTEASGRIDSCASLLRRQSGGKHQACGLTAPMHTAE